MLTDEFDVPEATMEDLKARVKLWNDSFIGNDYILEIVEERHIILTKAKHDFKVLCCYPCAIYCIGILLFVVAFAGLFLYSFEAFFAAFLGFILFIMAVQIIFVGLFCLHPKKVVFDVRFSQEFPITITVQLTGSEIREVKQEYESFRAALIRDSRYGGAVLF